jgi:hypothetical protein
MLGHFYLWLDEQKYIVQLGDGWRSTDKLMVPGEKLDKDRFRFDLGDLMTGYEQVLEKLKKVIRL